MVVLVFLNTAGASDLGARDPVMKATTVRSLATAAVALAITVGAAFIPSGAAHPPRSLIEKALNTDLPTILDTLVAFVGTLLALLAFGRFRRLRSRRDLFIAGAVALLAWAYTVFEIVPDLISPYSVGNGVSERVESWGAVVVRILAAWFLVAAARTGPPSRRHARGDGPRLAGFLGPLGTGIVGLAALVWLAPIGGGGLLHGASWPQTLGPALHLGAAALFLVAFVWLSRQATTESDPFLGWIAAGCVFAGFSMINFALLSSVRSGWLHSGALLQGAAVCTWTIGALSEILSYWSRIAEAARADTRRGLALELHDGLAQELALLATYTYAPAEVRAEPAWHEQLSATATRALAEARRAIAALSEDAVPFEADIERTVEGISSSDVDIRVDVDAGIATSTTHELQRESLVRIIREAVTNAVRHGGARHIDVVFKAGSPPRLQVFDDGVGFDPSHVADLGHLGLISMRERAEAIGASLAVHSAPGEGTTVEVSWP